MLFQTSNRALHTSNRALHITYSCIARRIPKDSLLLNVLNSITLDDKKYLYNYYFYEVFKYIEDKLQCPLYDFITTQEWFSAQLNKAEKKIRDPHERMYAIGAAIKLYIKYYLYIKNFLKLYIIVDKDLSPAQKAIQAVHAVCELNKGLYIDMHSLYKDIHAYWADFVKTLVILEIDNLEYNAKQFGEDNKDYFSFREPDLDNKLTAISLIDLYGKNPVLKTLTLAKFS